MRIALLGAGTIARLVLEHTRRGELAGVNIVAVMARPGSARARALAEEFGVPVVEGLGGLLASRPDAVVEAASHQAVRDCLVPLLESRTNVVVLSAGALADHELNRASEAASAKSGAQLYVPSGGIGGLDALKGACAAGVTEVSIEVAKPPAAWKGIEYVQSLGINLDGLEAPALLFEGSAREGVPHFPQNVNIAAVLSLAGIGFDRTRLKVVANPALTHNTHTIRIVGRSGRISVVMENVPSPENPKTALLACYSALAAVRQLVIGIRYGT